MSYCLYIYVAQADFPIVSWRELMAALCFDDADPEACAWAWRWRDPDGDDDAVEVSIHRITVASALAPAAARWRIDVRSAATRGPDAAWCQLAVPYRALRSMAQVEVCDPELWYTPPPRRFASAEAFYRHASRIVGYLAGPPALMSRGLMSGGGHLLF